MKEIDTSRWKLYRCIYDYDGGRDIEGDSATDVTFQRRLREAESGVEISWLIGTEIKYHGNTIICVELEGKKENLDLVLEMLGGRHG